jgi:hypothetical protein
MAATTVGASTALDDCGGLVTEAAAGGGEGVGAGAEGAADAAGAGVGAGAVAAGLGAGAEATGDAAGAGVGRAAGAAPEREMMNSISAAASVLLSVSMVNFTGGPFG